ncbi:MAG: UDP-N-acetylmuramoyl-L-alanine--D-glutamate ligase [Alphaproteobacteria bacterium]|nr:UDP-N-acetylmuramoyl-L-alanine--D-glutamate ligase [Alphaproteobacteria bacterium]
MIPLLSHRDDTILVVGLGKSGLSAARALTAAGARVSVWDDQAEQRDKAATKGFTVYDAESGDMTDLDQVIWSPGVPHTHPTPHPLAVKAQAANLKLRCDVDLLATAQTEATFVGITGTNGKSTTTALTAHVLTAAGKRVEVGGNLGFTALDLAPLDADGIYVLELSSYQTELTPNLHCTTAVLLNVTPDHLERHGGLDGYVAAKAQVFGHQKEGSIAIVGNDDTPSRTTAQQLASGGLQCVIDISAETELPNGVSVINGVLNDNHFDENATIDLRGLKTLPGKHNWQNAAAAYAVARANGVSRDAIAEAFSTFPGLRHRQELVGTLRGVTFVNDSKATNANAAEKALSCYGAIYWIAGGIAKAGGISVLGPLFDRVRHAFLIGESAKDFVEELAKAGVTTSTHQTLEDATVEAGRIACADGEEDATVLLSPACASFDMFKNFEERGDAFRTTVLDTWPEVAA